jgi:6-phosphogluconolactonase
MTFSSRQGLQWFFLGLSLVTANAMDSHNNKYLLFVGTYTGKDSKGIYAYRFDAAASAFTPLGVAAETTNPSFLAIDPSRRFLYAVNEVSNYKGASSGAVSSFEINHQTGKLKFMNQVPSRGADPCYISFDKTGKFTLVANYTGGSVAVFRVQKDAQHDGQLGESSAFIQNAGSSVDKQRQAGPHAHWIETAPDNRFAIAADLGLDKLLVYRFDAQTGALTPNNPSYAALDPGSGPRHLAFHPNGNFAYALNELQSTITAFTYSQTSGKLQKLITVSNLPKTFSGINTAGEIKVHPNGKFLFASNRGHDSIAIFSINAHTGNLSPVDFVPTQGKTPRNFEIDPTGKLLLVANQDSNNIVVFRIDPSSGKLTPTGQTLTVPAPVCLKFVAIQ